MPAMKSVHGPVKGDPNSTTPKRNIPAALNRVPPIENIHMKVRQMELDRFFVVTRVPFFEDGFRIRYVTI